MSCYCKRILMRLGLDPSKFQYVRKDYDSLTFLKIDSGRLMVIRR